MAGSFGGVEEACELRILHNLAADCVEGQRRELRQARRHGESAGVSPGQDQDRRAARQSLVMILKQDFAELELVGFRQLRQSGFVDVAVAHELQSRKAEARLRKLEPSSAPVRGNIEQARPNFK